ncbi:hypothetical protein Ddc_12310 [Ditylenchus destructor]|nr:hypothetical protein Ddc_12310 [Ditylenchus destructor]
MSSLATIFSRFKSRPKSVIELDEFVILEVFRFLNRSQLDMSRLVSRKWTLLIGKSPKLLALRIVERIEYWHSSISAEIHGLYLKFKTEFNINVLCRLTKFTYATCENQPVITIRIRGEGNTTKTLRVPSNENEWCDVLLYINNSIVLLMTGSDTPVLFQNAMHQVLKESSLWNCRSFFPNPFNVVLYGPLNFGDIPSIISEFGTEFRFYSLGSFSQVFKSLRTFGEKLVEKPVETCDKNKQDPWKMPMWTSIHIGNTKISPPNGFTTWCMSGLCFPTESGYITDDLIEVFQNDPENFPLFLHFHLMFVSCTQSTIDSLWLNRNNCHVRCLEKRSDIEVYEITKDLHLTSFNTLKIYFSGRDTFFKNAIQELEPIWLRCGRENGPEFDAEKHLSSKEHVVYFFLSSSL